jgi:hypothetical protein
MLAALDLALDQMQHPSPASRHRCIGRRRHQPRAIRHRRLPLTGDPAGIVYGARMVVNGQAKAQQRMTMTHGAVDQ